jgi:hypothetical protein
MLSLRSFHLAFILLSIVGADLFGVWALWHAQQGHRLLLTLGLLSIAGGFGLVVYAFRLVRALDRARIG